MIVMGHCKISASNTCTIMTTFKMLKVEKELQNMVLGITDKLKASAE